MPPGRTEDESSANVSAPAASSREGGAAGAVASGPSGPRLDAWSGEPGSRATHRVAGFHRIPVQQAEEWCWASVCLALQHWRGIPSTLCDVVRAVRGETCTRHGPGCLHRDCRQPESLARALRSLGIPYRRILAAQRWRDTMEALLGDSLVACEIGLEGTSHAVLLSSATPATESEPAWVGVDDPLPLRSEHRMTKLYRGGFRPTFLAAIG